MEAERSSPFTPDQESFLAHATGKKTEMDDITMSSLPGTPIAASTVMRQKGAMKERISANGKDSRGSLFGSNDPSLAQSNDSPQLMANTENAIEEESPLEAKRDEGTSNENLALSLEEKSSDNVEDFLRTHNVSGLLQKISLSQLSLSDRPLETRQSLMSQTSDTSLGILNLDSMQDISAGIDNYDITERDQSATGIHNDSEKDSRNSTSEKGRKDAMNQILKASKRNYLSSDTPGPRGQGLGEGQRLTNSFGKMSEKSLYGESRKDWSCSEHIVGDGNVRTVSDPGMPQGNSFSLESQTRRREGSTNEVHQVLRTEPQVDQESSIRFQEEEEERDAELTPSSAIDSSEGGRDFKTGRGWSDRGLIMSGIGEPKIDRRGISSSDSNSNIMEGRDAVFVHKPNDAPVSQGLMSLNHEEEEEEHEIDRVSIQAGLDQLDAMFFNPSPSSKSQRSGSGDGEESHCSSVQQSPRISQQGRDWPPSPLAAQHIRTESQLSATSIDFGEVGDQGNFLQDACEAAADESEIDTEDEIEAARKESRQEREAVMEDIVRPGIEGGSSGEEDPSPSASNLEPRPSAEGVVAVSPVPGDGGGGGDGMSDQESDSGASIGERSPVRNGVSGSGRSLDADQDGLDGDLSGDRDIEGRTRSQPVGDGIMDHAVASGRQVRFASHDDVTRWTPSGSAFHSRLRRPRQSEIENGDESLFPHPASTKPASQDDPSLINSQFLLPSHTSLDGLVEESGVEWSQHGDSLVFSQGSSHPSQPTDRGLPGGRTTSHSREFERTLTPGASTGDDSFPLRGCSLGSFGAFPTGGYTDVGSSQAVSFGEDFSLLQAEGGSGSDGSSRRSSGETSGRGNNRRSVTGESDSVVMTSQANQVVYLDAEGQGVTDLAFRTSLPILHKLGAVNPFDSFDNKDEVEQDVMNSIDFGVDINEEFLPPDQAAAVLNEDESEFQRDNIFHQDEQMSPDAYKDASDWSIGNVSHVTVNNDITGTEDFCRISLGTFFGKRTGALGSLSGSADTQRPTFGIDDVVSPPAREPVALVSISEHSSKAEGSDQEAFSPHHRLDGEGGDSKGNESANSEAPGSQSAFANVQGASVSSTSNPSNNNQEESGLEVTLGGGAGGTETPPLNLSDIAGIIGQISSKSNSEEILQKIIALSNKRSSMRQGKDGDDQGKPDGRKQGVALKEKKLLGDDNSSSQQRRNRSSAHGSRRRPRDGREEQKQGGRERQLLKGSVLNFDETKRDNRESSVFDGDTNSRYSGVSSGKTGSGKTDECNGDVRKMPQKRTAVATGVSNTRVSSIETQDRDNSRVGFVRTTGTTSVREEENDTEINHQTGTLNKSQNGSHLSQNLEEAEQLQRVGIDRVNTPASVGITEEPQGTSFRESVIAPNQEDEGNSWATSSSIRRSSMLSPRGFFKASTNVEREILCLSPRRFEVNERRSSAEDEEEEISPIIGTGIELEGKRHLSRHFDHPSTLLREESEPDGEPNSSEVGTVGGLPPIPQTSKSQSNSLSLQPGQVADGKSLDVNSVPKHPTHGRNFSRPSEIDKAPLESEPSAVSLQSSSRESINSKGMFVVGQHKVKQLSASLLAQSFNDTLRPNFKPGGPSPPPPASPTYNQDHLLGSSKGGHGGDLSSQECTTSSSLSSEEEAGQVSPSPPPLPATVSSSNAQPERHIKEVPSSTLPQQMSLDKRQMGSLQTRLEIDGEEAVEESPLPVASAATVKANSHLRPLANVASHGRDLSSGMGHYESVNTHASAALPTLLTSQSLMDAHLANQIVNSRPGSSLSGDLMDPRLSVQSLDSYGTSLSGHSASSQYGPGLSSHKFLGDTFSNLGRRPLSSQSSSASQELPTGLLQGNPYHDHLRHTQPGLPYQGYWHHGSLTEGIAHPSFSRGHTPHPSYLADGHIAMSSQPHSFPESQQQAPIMSVGALPGSLRHSSLPYGATHLGTTGVVLPSGADPQYSQFRGPVTTFGSGLHLERRSNSMVDGSLPPEYQRGPMPSCLDLPAHVRFKGVCCVGIASHTSLPLRNTSNRWLHCFMDIVQVTANGEEMAPESHSTFIIKQRTTISPLGTEQIKIIFVPKHPGIYTALLHVGSSTVVPDGDRNDTPHVPPQVVSLQALAESPCVEVLEDKDVFFGEMVHQSCRSKSLHIINRGRCTVPVRLLVTTSNSSSFSCFSVSTGEKRSDAVTSTFQRGTHKTSITPVHIRLKGRPGSDSDDDLATATTVWVHFKAPPRRQETDHSKDADNFSAQLDIEMDVPERILSLHSVNLRAVVGTANLHIPRKMHMLNFSTTVGNKDRRKLPLRNSGNIRLDIKFAISRAEELFSVHPEFLQLKPEEETSVEITYAPKEAPSAVESLLTMKVEGDGPQYEVVMRGEGTVEEKKSSSKDNPCLFSNKQFLSWGGVALGRALQQKIVLRNSSSSMPLKLKLSITGGPDFQLQSSFGSQLQLSDSKSLILKPEEDLPVNILFAPTMVASSQGLLIMKPVGGCSKYTVPLSGYGGVSSLSVDDLQAVGETSVLAIGNVNVGQRKVFALKVSNNGDRAAFVKVLCFSDLKAKVKLPKTHLSVEPHEFVIPAKSVEKLSVVYQPTERDAALCYCQSSMVAAVGFFSGDEIMRRQYQKALKLGQAQDFQMSADNPLKGVLFDKTFLKEKDEKSESCLPTRPNDIHLFYQCVSRVMVAVVGDASTGTQEAGVVNGILGNTQTPLNGDIIGSGVNRSDLGSVSPPVRGTRANNRTPSAGHQQTPTSRFSSNGPSGPWSLHPDHLMLTWTPGSKHSQGTARIHFCNLSERKLSFEIAWPGHILTITPQNGMVEPMEQKVLLVSANPSIQSKGVILPWSGTIYVSCDNQEKEIKVQIREDLALDTSIFPTSSKQLQSLSTEPSTPAAQRRPLPTATVSPKELKVRSKVISCEDAHVGQKSEFIFEFENTKPYPMKWNLSSFAPAYLKQADGTVCRTTYSAFRFESTSGEMTPGQKMQLSLHFMPREEGDYSQFWDLESSSTQNLVSHKTRIELSGHGLPKKRTSQNVDNYSRTFPKQNLYDQALAKQLSKSQPLDLTKVSKSVSSNNPIGLSKTTAMPAGNGKSTRHNSKKSSIVISESAKFDRCEANQSQTVTVRLKNCSMSPQTVKFVSPRQPFSITHHEHVIKPRHYLKLPVTFHPKTKGHFEAPLVIQTELQENLVVRLIGECF
ncbi:uncharacterized protein [Apostichopus japonicus]|uniref:uncharacterized protein isoform X2 n=1 Tax=Stichopus japonicus TaxID=307972 RepID=UPI003AB17147